MNIILIYFAIKYKGDWDKIYKALEEKEKVTLDEIRELEDKLKSSKWQIITILDMNYPNKLKEAYKPPFVIWYKGDINLLNNKFICVTGNQVDDIAKDRVQKFVSEIEKNYLIINPSFKGIDEVVMSESQKTNLIILANGLNDPYLNHQIKSTDLIMSEYPEDVHVSKDRLRNRNRLIAAFAETLILFTSKKDGPINNLITNFLNLGKELYCFPGDGSEEDGNSELIKQGANLITSIKDITKEQ